MQEPLQLAEGHIRAGPNPAERAWKEKKGVAGRKFPSDLLNWGLGAGSHLGSMFIFNESVVFFLILVCYHLLAVSSQ